MDNRIVIRNEDGSIFAVAYKKKPDEKKKVRDVMRDRDYLETKQAERGRRNYRKRTKLQQQKKNARGYEYYHNVVVPRNLGLEPFRPLGQKGVKSIPKPTIIFHGKIKVSFD